MDIKIIMFMSPPPGNILIYDIFKEYFYDTGSVGLITTHKCAIDLYKKWLEPKDIDIFLYEWGVPLDIFKDYGLDKKIDISNTGKFSEYLFRRDLHNIFLMNKSIIYERFRQTIKEQIYPNFNYSRKLNESWISVGGCCQPLQIAYYNNIFINDTYPKNFEIPASKSCLLTSDWGDREYQGFKDGENFIMFTSPRDALRKVLYYLDDKELLLKITNNGYNIVRKNHNLINNVNKLFIGIERKYAK